MPQYDAGDYLGKVLQDGIELKDVSSVNTDEGWAVIAELNEEGKKFVRDDKVATKKVYGKMEFIGAHIVPSIKQSG